MHNVLLGLQSSQTADVEALSGIPIPSFPRSRRLIVPEQRADIVNGIAATYVPFFNLTPFKQITMGLSVLWRLVDWGLRARRSTHRVVFSFNISVPPLIFTLVAARLIRATVMVYICDVNRPGETVPNNLLYRMDARLETSLLKYVDGWIVITDRIATDYAPGRRYLRMDGGVSRSLIDETGLFLAARRPSKSHFTIVVTGYLSPYNGFSEILQAFAQLEGSQYRLIVAGHGDLEGKMAAAAASDPRITFKGYLEYKDLLALHAAADVLVSMRVTSTVNTTYAFPSKTFEYLLSGVPVITTATGHMKTEYGPYCFILDDESPEALAGLLRRIERLGPAERSRIGLAARQYMIEHKTWEMQHKRIADYVRSTAGVHD
jgi:glycosyltransferase involved in cell wall biosynthesis